MIEAPIYAFKPKKILTIFLSSIFKSFYPIVLPPLIFLKIFFKHVHLHDASKCYFVPLLLLMASPKVFFTQYWSFSSVLMDQDGPTQSPDCPFSPPNHQILPKITKLQLFCKIYKTFVTERKKKNLRYWEEEEKPLILRGRKNTPTKNSLKSWKYSKSKWLCTCLYGTTVRPITLKWILWGLWALIEIVFSCIYVKFEPFLYSKKFADSPLKFGPVGVDSLGLGRLAGFLSGPQKIHFKVIGLT